MTINIKFESDPSNVDKISSTQAFWATILENGCLWLGAKNRLDRHRVHIRQKLTKFISYKELNCREINCSGGGDE